MARGQIWGKALIDIKNGKGALENESILKMNHETYLVSERQGTPTTTNLAKISGTWSVKASDLGWPSKGQDAMSQVRYGYILT